MIRKTSNIVFAGFSLAELLVAVLILGEIATFTIPKVLTAQKNAQRQAVFKEMIATLTSVYYQGSLTGELHNVDVDGEWSYLKNKVNMAKVCDSQAITNGCFPANSTNCGDNKGFLMHNGGAVGDLDLVKTDANGTNYEMVCLDWNGLSGPNTEGDDIIVINFYFGRGVNASPMPGQVTLNGAISRELYRSVFIDN